MTRWLLVLLVACGGGVHAPARPSPAPRAGTGRGEAIASAAPPGKLGDDRFEIVPQLGRGGQVGFVAFLADGVHAVTSSATATQVWQVENGIMLRELETLGALAVTGNSVVDGSLVMHDLATGARGPSLGDGAQLAAGTPDGTRLVAASRAGPVRVIDMIARVTLREIAVPPLRALAISADGKTALAIDDNLKANVAHVLDLETGRELGVLGFDHAWCAALSPDGKRAVLGGSDGAVWLYDVPSRQPIMTLTGHFSFVDAVAFMPDGKQAVSKGSDGTLRVWDLSTMRLRRAIKTDRALYGTLAVSPDGRLILSGGSQGGLQIWDAATGTPARTLRTIAAGSAVSMSADGRRELVASNDGLVSVWDLDTGARLRAFPQDAGATAVALSPDGARALVAGRDAARVLDTTTGKLIATSSKLEALAVAWLPDGRAVVGSEEGRVLVWAPATGVRQILHEYGERVAGVAASPDGTRVASAAWDGIVTVWDVARGAAVVQFRGHPHAPSCVAFSPDGTTIVSGGDGGTFAWDAATGRERWHAADHGNVSSVAFSADGRRVATTGYQIIVLDALTGAEVLTLHGEPRPRGFQFLADGVHGVSVGALGTSHVWNLETGAAYAQISSGRDWLIYTPDGYFDASRHGSELVAAVRGLEGYRIDQLALRNNRPDVVLRSIGMGQPELLDHFRARHAYRLTRAGVGEDALATRFDGAPRVSAFAVSLDGATAKLAFELASDEALRSYHVYVNDVALFGAQGKPAAGTRAVIRETIALSEGPNKIEVSGVDRGGAESMRAVRVVVADRGHARHELYFLGIGVSRYKHAELDLGYASKDVADLADVMRAMPGFAAVHVETYIDERATVANVRAARQFFANAGADDTLVLFVAGHGMRGDDAHAAFYFLTHDADPAALATTAADFDMIEDLLQGVAARTKLFLLDACESGEVDRERDAALASPRATRLAARGLVRTKLPRAAAPPGQRFAFDRERFIYDDVLRRSGAIVLSSSTGSELSYEAPALHNGVFSEALMTALTSSRADTDHDGRVTTAELQAFVTSEVARMTNGLQHPVIDRDNLELELSLPIASAAAAVVGH